jgi:hypothetical protein
MEERVNREDSRLEEEGFVEKSVRKRSRLESILSFFRIAGSGR